MASTTIKMPLYACGTCGAHFNRRYNAKRHSKIIDAGESEIVSFVEYMIGRSQGKYLPADPVSYRSKRSNNGSKIVHESSKTSFDHQIFNINVVTNLTHRPEPAQRDKNSSYLFDYENKNNELSNMQKLREKIEDLGLMLRDLPSAASAGNIIQLNW
jgi:hypothetical protein